MSLKLLLVLFFFNSSKSEEFSVSGSYDDDIPTESNDFPIITTESNDFPIINLTIVTSPNSIPRCLTIMQKIKILFEIEQFDINNYINCLPNAGSKNTGSITLPVTSFIVVFLRKVFQC